MAFNPQPSLDAYAVGGGSPLELAYLRVFERAGIAGEKQVPVAPEAGQTPISVADFLVQGTKTLVYVDGASFHRGQRLRRDRIMRDRLVAGGLKWRVVTLTAKDLRDEAAVVRLVRTT